MGGSVFESLSEVRSAANFPSASEFAMLGLNSLGPRGGGRFLLAFAKNSLRGHLPPSHVYTPLTSRGDFRAINAGGGGGKEIFGGLTSNAEEKGRLREREREREDTERIGIGYVHSCLGGGEGGEGVRNNRVSESAASVVTATAALRFVRFSPRHSSFITSFSTE